MKHLLIDLPWVAEKVVARLGAVQGLQVHVAPRHGANELGGELLRGMQILLAKKLPQNISDYVDLEYIQLATVGYENHRHLGLADVPARVCNARGVFDTAIAEWNLAMMVNLTRDLREMLRNQEARAWKRADRYQQEIRGRVVGLWGYGGIGRETARLAKAFGMRVHVLVRNSVGPRRDSFCDSSTGDPEGKLPDKVFVAGEERDFLGGLDFLVLALPHTQKTTGMVGTAELRALPASAFILNPSRGPIIQEQPLLTALREGWIAGAALDTHFAYPLPAEHPLWRLPNVILTPHISGADQSRNYPARIAELFAQNVERHLSGRPLLNLITRNEWLEA
jgi:phosphoglycerate dehydrogenase-like enzyme